MTARRVLAVLAAGKALAATAVLVAACTGPSAGSVTPPPSAGPSSVVAAAPIPYDALLDGAWRAGRHGCAAPTQVAVDHLAAVLKAELDAPQLDARIAASRWVSRHCA